LLTVYVRALVRIPLVWYAGAGVRVGSTNYRLGIDRQRLRVGWERARLRFVCCTLFGRCHVILYGRCGNVRSTGVAPNALTGPGAIRSINYRTGNGAIPGWCGHGWFSRGFCADWSDFGSSAAPGCFVSHRSRSLNGVGAVHDRLLLEYFVNQFFFLVFGMIANTKSIGNGTKLGQELCIQFFNIIHKVRLTVNLGEATLVAVMISLMYRKRETPKVNRRWSGRTGEQTGRALIAKPI